MQTSAASGPFRVLVAGGGVAALETMIALRALAGDRVETTLVAPDYEFHHRPLSTAEPFGLGEVQRFDLRGLTQGCGAVLHLGSLVAVDPERRSARTSRGVTYAYDALVIAVGARPRKGVDGALTFGGPEGGAAFRRLLDDLDRGGADRVVFALPGGVTWPLPLYELALLTADRLRKAGDEGTEIVLVTPEAQPMGLVGGEGSRAVERLLADRGVETRLRTYAEAFEHGVLRVVPGEPIPADAAVSLPRLHGVPIAGLPQDAEGFVETDLHGRVTGLEDVYAAGDITTFPIKQGGISAQQADAVAESIAARAGAGVTPRPFDPVLRGLLLTGSQPLYLRAELSGGGGGRSTGHREPLWWPPAKTSARYLTPYLAEHAGLAYRAPAPVSAELTPPADPERARDERARPAY